jgi:hypothetical protein
MPPLAAAWLACNVAPTMPMSLSSRYYKPVSTTVYTVQDLR